MISQIKPKSDKTPVITSHIDRKWHIITCLPDLDDENQNVRKKIYRAFILVYDLQSIQLPRKLQREANISTDCS